MAVGCDTTADTRGRGASVGQHLGRPAGSRAVPVATVIRMTGQVHARETRRVHDRHRDARGARRAGDRNRQRPSDRRLGGDAARRRRHRSGGPRPPARRHRDRTGQPGHGRRIPRSGPAVRHDPVESRHQSRHGAGRRGLCLRGLRHQRLQPHPPERDGVSLVSGHPDTADSRCGDLARHGGRRLLAPAGAGCSRSLPGAAGRAGTHLGRAGRHDPFGDLELRLPGRHRVQRAVQGGGQQ